MEGGIMRLWSVLMMVYFVFCVLDIRSVYGNGDRIWKPFLMPMLAMYFISYCIEHGTGLTGVPWLMVAGILGGCAGDTLLIREQYFVQGLAASLAGHVCYIAEFVREIVLTGKDNSGTAAIAVVAACYIVLTAVVILKLFPYVEPKMKGAVAFYMIMIMVMSFTAFLRIGHAAAPSFASTFIGSVLFIISDSILVFQVFAKKGGRGIMETYCAAQFLIATGVLLGV